MAIRLNPQRLSLSYFLELKNEANLKPTNIEKSQDQEYGRANSPNLSFRRTIKKASEKYRIRDEEGETSALRIFDRSIRNSRSRTPFPEDERQLRRKITRELTRRNTGEFRRRNTLEEDIWRSSTNQTLEVNHVHHTCNKSKTNLVNKYQESIEIYGNRYSSKDKDPVIDKCAIYNPKINNKSNIKYHISECHNTMEPRPRRNCSSSSQPTHLNIQGWSEYLKQSQEKLKSISTSAFPDLSKNPDIKSSLIDIKAVSENLVKAIQLISNCIPKVKNDDVCPKYNGTCGILGKDNCGKKFISLSCQNFNHSCPRGATQKHYSYNNRRDHSHKLTPTNKYRSHISPRPARCCHELEQQNAGGNKPCSAQLQSNTNNFIFVCNRECLPKIIAAIGKEIEDTQSNPIGEFINDGKRKYKGNERSESACVRKAILADLGTGQCARPPICDGIHRIKDAGFMGNTKNPYNNKIKFPDLIRKHRNENKKSDDRRKQVYVKCIQRKLSK